ncbi:glycosyltransferase [Kamptonema sp. UHCC 0994]|uniref:glycosyltransferase family 2 protein n=1 Tax=Kamptonema sp. UHCC 0994 TaxID=3031329 RepID=UPI0023B9CA31|nr:glycosyltransferase [Kamptonema sp. UHCC 0994]MDF0551739.1 glycosyltransferase [Kamptonema sp. UHCC 0994]
MAKLVSIIIPCFNAETWVGEAIESCFKQSYTPIDVIVIDDGSTDGSLEIIKNYDGRLIWETGPNRGGNYARNRGFELAKGEYIQYLDADDYLLPDKIERQVNFLDGMGADIVYGDVNYQYHLPDGEILQEAVNIVGISGNCKDVLESLLAYGCLPPIAYLFKKSAVINSIRWDETLKCGQDRDFLISLLIKGAKIVYQPGSYSIYRKYGNVTVSTSNKALLVESFCMILAKAETQLTQAGKLEAKYQKAIAQAYYSMSRKYSQDINFLCYCRLISQYILMSTKLLLAETKMAISKSKFKINIFSNEVEEDNA